MIKLINFISLSIQSAEPNAECATRNERKQFACDAIGCNLWFPNTNAIENPTTNKVRDGEPRIPRPTEAAKHSSTRVAKETTGHVSCQLPFGCMLHCRDFINFLYVNVIHSTLGRTQTHTHTSADITIAFHSFPGKVKEQQRALWCKVSSWIFNLFFPFHLLHFVSVSRVHTSFLHFISLVVSLFLVHLDFITSMKYWLRALSGVYRFLRLIIKIENMAPKSIVDVCVCHSTPLGPSAALQHTLCWTERKRFNLLFRSVSLSLFSISRNEAM